WIASIPRVRSRPQSRLLRVRQANTLADIRRELIRKPRNGQFSTGTIRRNLDRAEVGWRPSEPIGSQGRCNAGGGKISPPLWLGTLSENLGTPRPALQFTEARVAAGSPINAGWNSSADTNVQT